MIPVSVAMRKRCFGERCAKSTICSVERMCVRSFAERHRLARAAALGMDEQLRVRGLRLPALDVGGPDAGVHVALADPDRQLAAGHPLEPEAEVEVRQEEDLLVGAGSPRSPALALPDVQQ